MSLNPANTLYTLWAPCPVCYVRARANTAYAAVYRDGALVLITAATYELRTPGGTVLVSAAATIAADGTATYALTSSHLSATASLSALYLEVWTLTLTGGAEIVVERAVAVGRRDLRPVITDSDFTGPGQTMARDLPSGVTSFQWWIDSAWRTIVEALVNWGVHPQRLVSPETLRSWHIKATKAEFYEWCAQQQPTRGNYLELATKWSDRADLAEKEARGRFDRDDDGLVDDDGALAVVRPSVVHRNTGAQSPYVGVGSHGITAHRPMGWRWF